MSWAVRTALTIAGWTAAGGGLAYVLAVVGVLPS